MPSAFRALTPGLTRQILGGDRNSTSGYERTDHVCLLHLGLLYYTEHDIAQRWAKILCDYFCSAGRKAVTILRYIRSAWRLKTAAKQFSNSAHSLDSDRIVVLIAVG